MSIIKHKNGLFLYQQKSEEYMKKMQSLSYPTWETLHEDLYGFILSKYILLGDVTDVYNLTELAELSVAKRSDAKGRKADNWMAHIPARVRLLP